MVKLAAYEVEDYVLEVHSTTEVTEDGKSKERYIVDQVIYGENGEERLEQVATFESLQEAKFYAYRTLHLQS